MSDWFQTVADIEVVPAEAEHLAQVILEWLIASGVVAADLTDYALGDGHAPGPNCLNAVIEHDAARVTCPHCGSKFELPDDEAAWERLSNTVYAWSDGGAGIRTCWVCGHPVGLNEWNWHPPWGFGYLGFEFGNWPPLRNHGIDEPGRRLGHRVVLPGGKL